jgi:hypothetical protein
MTAPSPAQLRRAEAATWGDKPPARRPKMRLLDFRPLAKGALRGFARVELPSGLRISDVPLLVGKRGPFTTLPAKPVLDAERRQKCDANGKPTYAAVLEWRDRDLANRFSDAVVELVRREYPDSLDGAGR